MATEYKFMFDRRFDADEPPAPAEEDLSTVSVDGIPSISQLLDTLNERMNPIPEEPPPADAEKEASDSSDVAGETSNAEEETDLSGQDVETDSDELSANETNSEESEPTELNGYPRPPEEDAVSSETIADDTQKPVIPPSPVFYSAERPVYSENQLKAAEEKAREEGRLNGLEEGRESAWQEAMVSLQKQNTDTLLTIDASLKNILDTLQQQAQDSFSAAIDFALAVCKKAVPALCATNAIEEIRALLKNNLHFLKDEPKISLCLNPFLADQIKPVLADLIKKESYSGKIALVRDDSLAVGDCRIEWKNGGLEKNVQDVLNHTEELLKLYNHTVPTDQPSENKTGEEHHG